MLTFVIFYKMCMRIYRNQTPDLGISRDVCFIFQMNSFCNSLFNIQLKECNRIK